MEMNITVLESKTATSKRGTEYTIVLVRMAGAVGKLFSDVPLNDHIDEEITVEIGFSANRELSLSPRIVRVVG